MHNMHLEGLKIGDNKKGVKFNLPLFLLFLSTSLFDP